MKLPGWRTLGSSVRPQRLTFRHHPSSCFGSPDSVVLRPKVPDLRNHIQRMRPGTRLGLWAKLKGAGRPAAIAGEIGDSPRFL